jgi:hypothetical protein
MSYPFRREPRESQRKAMKDIFRTKSRLIWGTPGTGKTQVALDFIGAMLWHKKASRALVFCPNTALGVWEEQHSILCPHIPLQIWSSESESEPNFSEDGIIVVSYDYTRPRAKKKLVKSRKTGKLKKKRYVDKTRLTELLTWHPEIVVIDEGHKLKNPYSRTAKLVHQFADAEYKIDLTGTPTGNKKRLDLWSQFKFLKPDLLNPNFKSFKNQFGIFGGFGGFQFLGPKNSEILDPMVKPYITVIRKKGIESKTFIPYKVKLPPQAKKIYDRMEEEFITEVDNREIVASIALAKLAKLQQIAGGFIVTNDKETLGVHRAKLDALRDIAEEFAESGIDRFLIFARFHWEIDQIVELIGQKWTTYRITGKESPSDRKLAESMYNESGGVAVCQIATGSAALSFHKTDYAIFYSTDFSHINFEQAQYRIDRGEYTRPLFYYSLQAKGTVDTKIFRVLKENKDVSDEIRNIVEEIKREKGIGDYTQLV